MALRAPVNWKLFLTSIPAGISRNLPGNALFATFSGRFEQVSSTWQFPGPPGIPRILTSEMDARNTAFMPVQSSKTHDISVAVTYAAPRPGLVKSADLLTPSEPDAGSSAPDRNI